VAETALIAAVQAFLAGALQNPAPKTIGVVEPQSGSDLPAIVLLLDSTARSGNGLGSRSAVVTGALSTTAAIDLANPVLPGDPSFRLLDDPRTNLVLPHGGLVRSDGTAGPLAAADLSVDVAGTAATVVAGAPAAGQVNADPAIGKLTFGMPLPADGTVTASYFLGQWEQRVVRIKGVLRADACAADGDTTVALADALVAALTAAVANNSVPGLRFIDLNSLGSVGPFEQGTGVRRRTARFSFDFESEDNRPDSGGVIARIPINTTLAGTDPRGAGISDSPTVVTAR
jgi:hypothetical protein